MKLIDPDELERVLRPILKDESCPLHIAAEIDMNLDLMPKVDAVPVIRCGKCNFWDRDHISCEGLAKCLTGESGIRYRNRSDFCSRGERKDGDDEQTKKPK